MNLGRLIAGFSRNQNSAIRFGQRASDRVSSQIDQLEDRIDRLEDIEDELDGDREDAIEDRIDQLKDLRKDLKRRSKDIRRAERRGRRDDDDDDDEGRRIAYQPTNLNAGNMGGVVPPQVLALLQQVQGQGQPITHPFASPPTLTPQGIPPQLIFPPTAPQGQIPAAPTGIPPQLIFPPTTPQAPFGINPVNPVPLTAAPGLTAPPVIPNAGIPGLGVIPGAGAGLTPGLNPGVANLFNNVDSQVAGVLNALSFGGVDTVQTLQSAANTITARANILG